MADDDDKGKGTDDKGTGDKGGGADRSAIREVVSDVLGELFKSGRADVADKDDSGDKGKGKGRSEGPADISRQVEDAVRAVQARDKEAKRQQQMEDRLKAVEDKTATPERVPRQVRRVTRFMWGDDDGQ